MTRNSKLVSRILFGRGCFNQLDHVLEEKREDMESFMIFIVDDVFLESDLRIRLPVKDQDLLLWVNVDDEPKTAYVDELTHKVRDFADHPANGVIGIGGGSTMDIAKALSLMLTNPGSATEYQGWDLIRNSAVYHVGIPTLSGTGAEASRTAVLTGPEKKLGVNSDHTVFDQLVLDPELVAGAPFDQRFYTGMDCFIHCVESLSGNYLNTFSRSYGEKAIDLCREVFLNGGPDSDDKLMMASYFGGISIAYSQVGVCHALSYGLSFVLGIHHGIGNCVIFNHLEDFYPEGVQEFRQMLKKNKIELPPKPLSCIGSQELKKMTDIALGLDPLWEHALGSDWKKIATREKIGELYQRLFR
ncbi:MAG: iron-containing alcohol dehydrogenase family protein [Pseudomonadota bacterium]